MNSIANTPMELRAIVTDQTLAARMAIRGTYNAIGPPGAAPPYFEEAMARARK
ncbi:MAG TPA: hypothetical protein VF801_01120 [Rhodocyclaceae bacterium]